MIKFVPKIKTHSTESETQFTKHNNFFLLQKLTLKPGFFVLAKKPQRSKLKHKTLGFGESGKKLLQKNKGNVPRNDEQY